MLVSCSGSPPISAPAVSPQGHAFARRALGSGQPLLYTFGSFGYGNGLVVDYPSGTIVSGFVPKPFLFNATCSDSEGNVYLGGGDATSSDPAISEYAYGATTPSAYAVVTSQSYGVVDGCAVDPASGNIAAVIEADAPDKAVAVFAPQLQGAPQIYAADSSMLALLSASYDNHGNLFLLGITTQYTLEFSELLKGSHSFEAISLDLGSHAPKDRADAFAIRWATQWDGQYITIEGAYAPKPNGKRKTWKQAVYRLSISGSAATVTQTILLKQRRFRFYATYWITPALGSILETDDSIREFRYPAGKGIGKLRLGGHSYVSTIAVPPSH